MTKFIKLITILFIVPVALFAQKINLKNIEGYYEYLRICDSTKTIIDSVRCKFIFLNNASDDLPIIEADLIDFIFLTDTSFLYLWSVEVNDNKLEPTYFKLFQTNLKKDETWSLKSETGFGSGTFGIEFKCLSMDTTIAIKPLKLDHLKLIEERRWVDVGGIWDTRIFGFDKEYKIAYYEHYYDKCIANKDIFIINNFVPKYMFDDNEATKWLHEKKLNSYHWTGINRYKDSEEIIKKIIAPSFPSEKKE